MTMMALIAQSEKQFTVPVGKYRPSFEIIPGANFSGNTERINLKWL